MREKTLSPCQLEFICHIFKKRASLYMKYKMAVTFGAWNLSVRVKAR